MQPTFSKDLISTSIVWGVREAVVSRTDTNLGFLGLKVLEGKLS